MMTSGTEEQELSDAPPRMRGVAWRTWGASAFALATACFAFRDLVGYVPPPLRGEAGRLAGVGSWAFAPGMTPVLLPYALCLAVLLVRRRILARSMAPGSHLALSLPLFLACAALFVWSQISGATELQIWALALALIATGAFLGGARTLSLLVCPAALLMLAAPLPAAVLHPLIFGLQMVTAHAVTAVLTLFGQSPEHVGDLIGVGERVFQVIETCSGLRAIEALVMAALFYAGIFPVRAPRGAILVAAAPLLGLFANVIRVTWITLTPTSTLDGEHDMQGLVTIIVGAVMLGALDYLLTPLLPVRSAVSRSKVARQLPLGAPAGLAAFYLALCVASTVSPDASASRPRHPRLSTSIPTQLGDWWATGLRVDRVYHGSVTFTDKLLRSYSRNGERSKIRLFVAIDERDNLRVSARSPKTRYPGAGWRIADRSVANVEPVGRVETLVVESATERRLVYHWREADGPGYSELARALLAVDRRTAARRPPLRVFRLETGLDSRPGSRARADERLRDFVGLLAATDLYPASPPAAQAGL